MKLYLFFFLPFSSKNSRFSLKENNQLKSIKKEKNLIYFAFELNFLTCLVRKVHFNRCAFSSVFIFDNSSSNKQIFSYDTCSLYLNCSIIWWYSSNVETIFDDVKFVWIKFENLLNSNWNFCWFSK